MLATLVAVLALAGAPASTRVECAPYLDARVVLAVTVRDTIPGPLSRVFLGTTACGALLYSSSTPRERAAFRRLNPSVDFDHLVGVGIQVTLHEALHVALDSSDECLVEKYTRSKIDGLLSQLADPGHAAAVQAAATASDAALPPQYHC